MVSLDIRRAKRVIAAHCLLGVAPAFMPLVVADIRYLPILWSLTSVTVSQLMLVSVYLGMTAGKASNKLLAAATAATYLAIWPAIGEYFTLTERSAVSFGVSYLRFLGADAAALVILALLLAGAGRILGYIQLSPPAVVSPQPRLQFSLLALLVTMSAVALLIGLVRASRLVGPTSFAGFHYLLTAVVFAINTLAAVWATLGYGAVTWRLITVLLVSATLGISIGVAGSLDTIRWWLLASSSLLTLLPTAILAFTLLCFRGLGFRLVRMTQLMKGEC